MRILGIETSCDETGIAIYESERGLLAHAIYSQVDLHAQYGGVVPELASRDHVRKCLPLIDQVLREADLQKSDITGIAYTEGPGLIGALLVGSAVANALAFAWNIPCVGVHHMEGHLLAPMLEPDTPTFPFVALLVSGGHTILVEVNSIGQYRILGESIDDAAGEAFDKTAKLLGLGYPGGPQLAKIAEQGDAARFQFPRPMTNRPGLDFSFSGLKTFAINTFRNHEDNPQTRADIAVAFEDAIVDTLRIKCERALKFTGLNNLVIAGGVGANKKLREKLQSLMQKQNGRVFFPRPDLCTDNGAMIAYAGYVRLQAQTPVNCLHINARPRWPMDTLDSI